MGGIVHIVLFRFKDVGQDKIQDACENFISLKDQCLHAETKLPYIKSLSGGRDNSPEGVQRGMTHAFVAEFGSEKDRNYYVHEDPAHVAFKTSLKDLIAGAQVIDYTPGVFTI